MEKFIETIHVGDVNLSHVDPRVIDDYIQFIDCKYRYPYIGELR